MSHRWLVGASVLAHVAVGVGLFVSGVWRIERVQAGRLRVDIATPLPIPAPSGGAVAANTLPFERKHIVKETVQPEEKKKQEVTTGSTSTSSLPPREGPPGEDPDIIGTCVENCGTAEAAQPVCGDSAVDVSEQCDDGNTINGDGCSSTCRTEVKKTQVVVVPPTVLQGLRISGETQVHPSTGTQTQMLRDGATGTRGVVKLCLSTNGAVTSANILLSTKYAGYDETILSAVRHWRYRPYTVNGTPIPACSTVTFVYSIRN
jgi:TonB family protein